MKNSFLETVNYLPLDYYKNITYYEISFGPSRSKYFDKAIEIAEKYENSKVVDNKVVVTIGNDNFEDLENLISCIYGWKSASIKIDGKTVPAAKYWDLCGRSCFRHAPKTSEYLKYYCTFGANCNSISEIYDIKWNHFFGCTRLWMPFWLHGTTKIESDHTYLNIKFEKTDDHSFKLVASEINGCDLINKRLKNGYYNNKFPDWLKGKIYDDGYFYVDKNHIKSYINSKLMYIKGCPVFDIDKCFERVDIFFEKIKYENGSECETMSKYLKLLLNINCININEINDSLLEKWRKFSNMDELLS